MKILAKEVLFAEVDGLQSLKIMVKDAVNCPNFENPATRPQIVRWENSGNLSLEIEESRDYRIYY